MRGISQWKLCHILLSRLQMDQKLSVSQIHVSKSYGTHNSNHWTVSQFSSLEINTEININISTFLPSSSISMPLDSKREADLLIISWSCPSNFCQVAMTVVSMQLKMVCQFEIQRLYDKKAVKLDIRYITFRLWKYVNGLYLFSYQSFIWKEMYSNHKHFYLVEG